MASLSTGGNYNDNSNNNGEENDYEADSFDEDSEEEEGEEEVERALSETGTYVLDKEEEEKQKVVVMMMMMMMLSQIDDDDDDVVIIMVTHHWWVMLREAYDCSGEKAELRRVKEQSELCAEQIQKSRARSKAKVSGAVDADLELISQNKWEWEEACNSNE